MIFLDTLDKPLVVGDDYTVRRSVVDLPEDDTVTDAWLTLKTGLPGDDDAPIILAKHIAEAEVLGVGMIQTDSLGVELIFEITAAESSALDPHERHIYDIQVLTSNGKRLTRERGYVTPKAQITTA